MVDIKPPTVSKYFYFFSLVTGNIVVGWTHFGICILMILSFLYLLVFKSSTTIEVENVKVEIENNETHDEFTDTFDIIIRLVILVVAVFVAFISFWFVHGIKMSDPTKMKPYLILTGTFVFLGCCAAIVTLNFFTLVIAVLELYFFICAYSLYLSFFNDPNIQQDVMFKNPTAYGYSQAIETDGLANGGGNYYPQAQQHQQQPQTDGYYNQGDYFDGNEQQQHYNSSQ